MLRGVSTSSPVARDWACRPAAGSSSTHNDRESRRMCRHPIAEYSKETSMSTKLRTLLQTCLIAAASLTASHALADGIPGEQSEADKIQRAPDCVVGALPQAYTVVLDGFTSREMMLIEEYLAAFRCFDHMRPLQV